ncbi:hypothetical protein L1887_17720 [Cichorium endivia]|nr:hypothetical protein L1887_17720 [Cichorium endivia]
MVHRTTRNWHEIGYAFHRDPDREPPAIGATVYRDPVRIVPLVNVEQSSMNSFKCTRRKDSCRMEVVTGKGAIGEGNGDREGVARCDRESQEVMETWTIFSFGGLGHAALD